jgi:capsid protein
MIKNFHLRVFKMWIELAVLTGELDFPDYSANSMRYCKPRWTPPAQHYVDPLKEIKAYREAEQAGYMTKSQVIAQTNGGDYDDIVSEIAREQDVAQGLGVTLDKDLDLEVEIGQEAPPTPPPTRAKKTRKKKTD